MSPSQTLTQMEISRTDLRTSLTQREERSTEGRLQWPTFFNKKQPMYFINENKRYIITHSGIKPSYYLETHPQISLLI